MSATDFESVLDHCLDDVVGAVPRADRGPIDEFKAITKYL